MGSRCWDCGTKVGRCYEHGSSACGCVSCRCDPLHPISVTAASEDEDVDW